MGRALKRIKEQMQAIPDHGLGYGVLRYLDSELGGEFAAHEVPEIGFNYLGRFPTGREGDWLPAPDAPPLIGETGPDWPLPHAIAINARVEDGTNGPSLHAYFRFAPALVRQTDVSALAEAWCSSLEALADHSLAPNAGGRTPSDFCGLELTQDEIEEFERRIPDLFDLWPLTPVQEGLLFHATASDQKDDPYIVQLALDFDEPVDRTRLRRALDLLLERHAGLRASVQHDRAGRPLLAVAGTVRMPWAEHDLSQLQLPDRDAQAKAIETQDRHARFTLEQAPLIRSTLINLHDGHARLLLSLHHLLADGWSGAILLRDLQAFYRHAGAAALPAPPDFRAYLAYRREPDRAAAESAWQNYLQGFKFSEPLPESGAMHQIDFELPSELTGRLERVAQRIGVTSATVLQGAWATVLGRITGRNEVCFGLVSSGRHWPVPGIENMVGLLIATTPVRLRASPSESIAEVLVRLQNEQLALQPHLHLPLRDIQRVAGHRFLFDTLFTFENYPANTAAEASVFSGVRSHSGAHYALNLAVVPADRLTMHLHYNSELFSTETANLILARLRRVLEQIADNPDASSDRIDALGGEERRRLLVDFSGVNTAFPGSTLAELFAAQAKKCPSTVALVCAGQSMTYAGLDAASNRLARILIEHGAGPEKFVALCLPRSLEMVTAILAVLKSGAAYVPLDPINPEARLAFFLKDAAPVAVLTTRALATLLPAGCLILDDPAFESALANCADDPVTNEERHGQPRPDHPAYVVYTSGSSGMPKGVIATHRNVVRLFHSDQMPFEFRSDDVWTLFHSFAFDFSAWEIWGALLHGGRLVIVPQDIARTPSAFCELLVDEKVSVLSMTPAAFARLPLTELESRLALRTALIGGEAYAPDRMPHPRGVALRNVYGPTETTIFATMGQPFSPSRETPIGRPLPNVHAYVLDNRLRPCPLGVAGELYLSGHGLARGYLGRAALTATRFIAHPYAAAGQRLYRTGDLCAWTEDGQLLFRGRADEQLKIHGFRIEPGEIEAVLCALPGVAQAAVIPRQDQSGNKRLVAYLVAARGAADPPDIGTLRDALAQRLPYYMVPSAFVVLDALPLNPNGKLERKALPAPGTPSSTHFLAPQTPEADLLCSIVRELLCIEQAGLADNFFYLGGDLLLAVQLSAQIRTRLGRHIPVQAIFETPVLGDLAARVGVITDATTAFGRVLTLRAEGSLPPLICLYPGTGLGWPYANLLSILNPEQPLYAIQPATLGLGSDAPLPGSFDEIIDEAYGDLCTIAGSKGPCVLAGWSFGGVLAHCLAARLQQDGSDIRGLMLFDSYPMPPEAVPDYSKHDALWRDVALGAGLVLPADATGLDAARIQAIAAAQGHIFGTFPLPQLTNLARLMANNTRLLPTARLRRFAGSGTIFTAAKGTKGMDRQSVSPTLWQPWFGGQIKAVAVAAEHHTMMAHDAVAQMRRHFA